MDSLRLNTGRDNYRLLASDRVDSVSFNTGKNNYRLLASDRVDSVILNTGIEISIINLQVDDIIM